MRNQSLQTADHVVVNYLPVERVHLPRTNHHEVAHCWVVVLKEARSESRSRKLPQSDAGGERQRRHASTDCSTHDEQRVSWDRGERINSLTSIGFIWFRKAAVRPEYCLDNKKSLCNLRSIQGHSGMRPEMRECTFVPYNWKESIFHRELRGILNPFWEVE